MPGPMSNPSGRVKLHKFVEDRGPLKPVVRWISTSDLTGEQRAYLASRKRLYTGKTDKKKESRE